MGRRLKRISAHIVIGMAQCIGLVEDKEGKNQQEHTDRKAVFNRVKRVERQRVLLGFRRNPNWIVLPRVVQRPNVQSYKPSNHEWQQEVQRKEAVQRRIINRISTKKPLLKALADDRNSAKEASNHCRAPKRHLAPRQCVTEETCCHHHKIDKATDNPQKLARRLVGAVIKPPEHVHINGKEEHRRANGMHWLQEPTKWHIAFNTLHGIKGMIDMRDIMHRKDNAGDDLADKAKRQDAAKCPPVIQITRTWEGHKVCTHADDRQALIHPFGGSVFWLVCRRMSAHV